MILLENYLSGNYLLSDLGLQASLWQTVFRTRLTGKNAEEVDGK
jgi:hypothetical protein